jgi:hypothetical protein
MRPAESRRLEGEKCYLAELPVGALRAEHHLLAVVIQIAAPAGRVRRAF